MDKALRRGRAQPAGRRDGVFQGLSPGQGFGPSQQRVQPWSFQVLHHEEVNAAIFSNEIDLRDIGMAQPGLRARLALEALDHLRVMGDFGCQDLDGHRAFQRRVVAVVDRAHAPAAEQTHDLEVLQIGAFQRVGGHPGLGFSRALDQDCRFERRKAFLSVAHNHQTSRSFWNICNPR